VSADNRGISFPGTELITENPVTNKLCTFKLTNRFLSPPIVSPHTSSTLFLNFPRRVREPNPLTKIEGKKSHGCPAQWQSSAPAFRTGRLCVFSAGRGFRQQEVQLIVIRTLIKCRSELCRLPSLAFQTSPLFRSPPPANSGKPTLSAHFFLH